MNLQLEVEYSKADIIQQATALKQQVDGQRPLPPDIEGKVMQKLRLEWNYNSNAIEGNRLSYGETTALLMHGITAKGKPLKDHLDIQGHNRAIGYLERIVQDGRLLIEADIRALHEIILVEPYQSPAQTAEGQATQKRIQLGRYKTMPNHVKTITGEIHYYATPEETPAKMNDLMDWYNAAAADASIHPAVVAALFHHKFVAIHPFDDGNGRLARILMNLILMQNGYPPVVVKQDNRDTYYGLLSQSDAGDDWPFVEYISELLSTSLQLYIKAINGGDIDEDEDLDKEIALFKIEMSNYISTEEQKSKEIIINVFKKEIFPLVKLIEAKSEFFKEYFLNTYIMINLFYEELKQVQRIFEKFSGLQEDMLDSNPKNYTLIHFSLHFDKFRNELNDFNITENLSFKFDLYRYIVNIDNIEMCNYLYHENISNYDKKNITKKIILSLKEKIENSIHKKLN